MNAGNTDNVGPQSKLNEQERIDRVGDHDPLRVQVFLDGLRQCQGPRISNTELWTLFSKIFPYKPGSPEGRQLLLEVLQEADHQEVIRLPPIMGKRWDRALSPPLPTSVQKRELPPLQRHRKWQTFPWRPQLSWVADLEVLSPEQETFLLRVQEALVQGILQKQAPLKYRSLQLTGHEKRLGELARTSLFLPGRLSFELLGCVPEIPPLALERVGEGNIALIFENVGAFRTAYEVLRHIPQSLYGWLGFGAGASFERSILHFKLFDHPIERIEYVGDIDRPGLRIAQSVARLAASEGLPQVVPANGLHRAMLTSIQQFGHADGLEYRENEKKSHPGDEFLISWLPGDVRSTVLAMIRSGKRIPEEVLGPDEMRNVWVKLIG